MMRPASIFGAIGKAARDFQSQLAKSVDSSSVIVEPIISIYCSGRVFSDILRGSFAEQDQHLVAIFNWRAQLVGASDPGLPGATLRE
jgi:hypothetical protein